MCNECQTMSEIVFNCLLRRSENVKTLNFITFQAGNIVYMSNEPEKHNFQCIGPCGLSFIFYKGFLRKYKGNIGSLVSRIFHIFCSCLKNYKPHRAIRLINTFFQIKILPQFLTSYVIWHLSQNAIKCHFMAYYDVCHMT